MTEKANPKAKASPKAKANPKAKSAKKVEKKEIDNTRFLNMGKEVELSIGTYTFKELSAWDLTEIVTKSFDVFSELLADTSQETNEYKAFARVLGDPTFKVAVCGIIAKFTSEDDPTVFENLRVADVKKVISAIKEVTDLEEIKELFFELGLQNILTMSQTSTES